MDDGLGDGFGGVAFDEMEVVIRRDGFGEPGNFALVDGVGGLDDAAFGGLAEDFGEAGDGQGAAVDEVF